MYPQHFGTGITEIMFLYINGKLVTYIGNKKQCFKASEGRNTSLTLIPKIKIFSNSTKIKHRDMNYTSADF
jgi:hypothetical protein